MELKMRNINHLKAVLHVVEWVMWPVIVKIRKYLWINKKEE